MEWLKALRYKTVGLDTAPLIYYIEENPAYLPVVQPFFESLDRGEFQVVTSTITLLEVLVHPIRRNNPHLARQYRNILLNAEGLDTLHLDADIAEHAARLRGEHNIRTPDAIQMATAIHAGALYFLTNDAALPELPNLSILLVDDLRKERR